MSALNVFISKDQKQVMIGAFEVLFGVVKYLFLDKENLVKKYFKIKEKNIIFILKYQLNVHICIYFEQKYF